MGKTAQNPEATRVRDEEVQEAHWSSVVGSIPERVANNTKVLETGQQMVVLIITLMLLSSP